MNTCKDCKWYAVFSLKNNKPNLYACANDTVYMLTNTEDTLFTSPDFGCNQWEEKK